MPRLKIDALQVKELEVPAYSSGAVCTVLEIEPRRLHNYLSGSYQLWPSGKPGKGRGQRHWFYVEDVYRLGIAHHLFKDGFSPRLISRLLQRIDDGDFFVMDENGIMPHPVIGLQRGRNGTEFEFYHANRIPTLTLTGRTYYLLDVDAIVRAVDAGIRKLDIEVRQD